MTHVSARATLSPLTEAQSQLRLAAILLLSGTISFWAGAFTPPWRWWFPISDGEFLALVAAHTITWRWIAASFAVGVMLTLAGFTVLGVALRAAGARLWADLGHSALMLGSAGWIASIAFRATATVAAANQAASSGTVPEWFAPVRDWAGVLFAIYMLLAYLALAAYGKALLQASLGARWVARVHLVFGLVGAIGFLARIPIFNPPLMIHLAPGVFGVATLLQLRAGARGRRPAPGSG